MCVPDRKAGQQAERLRACERRELREGQCAPGCLASGSPPVVFKSRHQGTLAKAAKTGAGLASKASVLAGLWEWDHLNKTT